MRWILPSIYDMAWMVDDSILATSLIEISLGVTNNFFNFAESNQYNPYP